MQLTNEFDVPRPLDEAWAVLTDVERIAPCMPGAQLTEVDGDTYHGTVKVKVGPVVAQYGGQARFIEKDADAHRAVLEAKGKEKTGRGLANAVVTAQLAGQGESTHVTVTTDLTISGPLAQFGRGAIAEVSTKLLNQFVERLRETVLNTPSGAAVTAPPAATTVAPAESTVAPAAEPPAAEPPAAETPDAETQAAEPPAAEAAAPPPVTSEPSAATANAVAAPPPAPSPRRIIQSAEAEPADLLSVARGTILKRLIPVVLVVAIIVFVVLIWA